MKKILFTLLAVVMLGSMSVAQVQNDQRTLATKIADLLAQMPAKDSAQLASGMKEMASMGETGLVNMTAMLSVPGKGDNSQLEYAINGFSYYATQPGKEDWRKMSEHAWCQALEKTSDKVNKAFIISQLQIVGQSDETVSSLKNYLNDDQLCDPAARALIKINSSAANKVLLLAAQNAQGTCQLSLIKALGESHNVEAISVITPLANSNDKMLAKVALNALANIADASSESILANAAEKSGFTFDPTNATDSYLLYLSRLAENGNLKLVKNAANALLKNAKQDNQVAARIAAMTLLAHAQADNNIEVLADAAGDKNPEYRAAALKLAVNNITPATTGIWVKKLKKANPEIQAEIITMLGDAKAEAALPAMLNALKNKNKDVRIAAISAAGKTGGESALPALLSIMKNGSEEEATAVKNAIDIMKGDGVVNKVADALPAMPANAKAALVNVLGARAAHDKVNIVFSLLKEQDTLVRSAAFSALKSMVNKEDLPTLFSLLNTTSQPGEISAITDAIIAAIGDVPDPSQQSAIALQEMAKASENKKPLFYNILAAIGGSQSMEAVSSAFNNGNADTKKSALNALATWSDSSAANVLYKIGFETSNSEYLDIALKGLIRSINKGTFPDAEKLLMLRKAMDIAKTTTQKQIILKEVGKNRTFPALIFAGNYLDDASLQQEAAH
ncbi:MAG TPA: HEAT repeat domain-containing protein, partial [Hanamia sp.]|nr:HEAT repeat domain-containing protein [Hanamia sp.]